MGDPRRQISRRALAVRLGGGLVAAATVGGCRWTDPVIRSADGPTPAPTTPDPTPDADQLAGASAELDLAGRLVWLSQISTASASVKAWASAAARAHQLAAHLLGQLDPMAVPPGAPGPVSPVTSGTEAATLTTLKQRSAAVAAAHRQRALAATTAPMALTWASLQVTALSQSVPGAAMLERVTRPHPFEPGTAEQAQTVLLERLHAIVQGFENGVAVIGFSDPRRAAADARLAELVLLLDQTATAIRLRGGDPPPPRAGYQQPLRPRTAEQAWQLFGLLERDLLNAHARQVAATQGAPRDAALSVLAAQVPHCQAWRAPMVVWPGWA